ncbi:MAG: NepR family anti-sigma factor [Hyphomicrobiaceae bacterium]
MTDEKREEAKPDARVDANVRAHLGRKLKTAYQALVEEPVPDRFVKLLEELRSKEGKS